ncbi:MAG: UTP--glucose-1-phosphate uridylyltransferase [Cyanobacteria bacterium SID2]|nr:UTP--glucose-1-phosphate uridylyltransferase [Cyanobacteria bacterium SID2]MBP0003392.1 UTP--glucose-1-phosphate uridylyltransferase [Cyanobacteria bacterium SBC]
MIKAVIPAAGFGTRLFPASQVVKKELFPVIDGGRTKPAILAIVEEAVEAGLDEIAIVVRPGDVPLFASLFEPPPSSLWEKLKPLDRAYSEKIQGIGKRVTLLTQEIADGYGHAVWCAKDWVGNEPFVLFLGDHVYRSNLEISCTEQLIEVYHRTQTSVISLRLAQGASISHSGCVSGDWMDDRTLSLSSIVEKPTLEEARANFQLDRLNPDEFLSMFGIYVLKPQIFECLEQQIQENMRDRGEFQLTSALEALRPDIGMMGFLVNGRCFDFGMPHTYFETMVEFSRLNA